MGCCARFAAVDRGRPSQPRHHDPSSASAPLSQLQALGICPTDAPRPERRLDPHTYTHFELHSHFGSRIRRTRWEHSQHLAATCDPASSAAVASWGAAPVALCDRIIGAVAR